MYSLLDLSSKYADPVGGGVAGCDDVTWNLKATEAVDANEAVLF
jgi:hypothetical protein